MTDTLNQNLTEAKHLEDRLTRARRVVKWHTEAGTPYAPEACEAADELRRLADRLGTLALWIKQGQKDAADHHRRGIGEK